MKKLVYFVLLLAIVLAIAVWQRHRLMIATIGDGAPPPLLPMQDEAPPAGWFDDYFLLVPLDPMTYAIAEPRYEQQNFSYLIIGEREALLFDAGPGVRDIGAVVASITDLPVTFVPSHFHYDHVGNEVEFERIAVIDLPHLRERAPSNRLTLTWEEHVGSAEGFDPPTWTVTRWLQPGEVLDLGGRELKVLHTPGHTVDSISLYDIRLERLYSGDFIYPGALYAFLPNSGMGDYLQAADRVLGEIGDATRVLGAHRAERLGLPEVTRADVLALRDALVRIRAGEPAREGFYPRVYDVNDRVYLLAEPRWLQDWTPAYPTVD